MGRTTNLKTALVVSLFLLVVLAISGYCEAQEPLLLVADINPGAGGSGPTGLTNVNGTLFFAADKGKYGYELWKSDGTEAGTVMVKDINPGAAGSSPQELVNINGTLFFSARDYAYGYRSQLWKSDGTEAGTVMVKEISHGIVGSGFRELTDVNGTLFFSAYNDTDGRELWKSDGTEAGTVMVKDIGPGAGFGGPEELTNVNGTLFFVADDGARGRELWKSDGSEAGTVMVKDINPGASVYGPVGLTDVNGTLFFVADDGAHGYELWKSDGTEAGTRMVKDIIPGAGYPDYGELTNFNGTLFFSAFDLWKSDGTEAGTVMVKDFDPGVSAVKLTNVNGTLFFVVRYGIYEYELWKSDGTEAGTVKVKGMFGSYYNPTNVNGTLFFNADDGTHGRELWRSNGTEAGTVMVADINPGAGGSDPEELTDVNGTLFFDANDGTHGNELWSYYKDIFVDASASGANNGRSWANAYNHLQDALSVAISHSEIRVADGFYKPDANTAHPFGTGDRAATFRLINNVALYGGFPSGGGDFSERDPNRYKTILSGKIGLHVNRDNSYHVVTASGVDANAVLDGFTITGGNADGSLPNERGAGMYIDGSPTVNNCIFSANRADAFGGGICTHWAGYSKPILTNCVFTDNYAGSGGGMLNHASSEAMLVNCIFVANWAVNGGGMHNYIGEPSVINCTFSGNRATNLGGGIYNNESTAILTNDILWGNSDSAGTDKSGQIYNLNCTPVINYCCIQGWRYVLGSKGNIRHDPLFKDADGPDDIPGTEDDNLQLAAGSPCIDAGDNTAIPPDTADLDDDGDTSERIPLDLTGNARFTDDPLTDDTGVPATGYAEIVEMGAYERYEFCGSGAYPYPPGDVSGPDGVRDCFLDFYDFAVWAAHWMQYSGPR